jgi:hypothetical protein
MGGNRLIQIIISNFKLNLTDYSLKFQQPIAKEC